MASKVRQKLLKLWWWFRVGVFHCRQYIMQIVLTVQILLLILFLIKWTLLAIDSDCLPKVCYLKLKNSDNLSPVKPLPQVSKLPSVWFLIHRDFSSLCNLVENLIYGSRHLCQTSWFGSRLSFHIFLHKTSIPFSLDLVQGKCSPIDCMSNRSCSTFCTK